MKYVLFIVKNKFLKLNLVFSVYYLPLVYIFGWIQIANDNNFIHKSIQNN